MSGLSCSEFGRHKQRRCLARLAADDIARGAEVDWDVYDYCDDACERGECSLCDPDWADRVRIRERLSRAAPTFTMAERILAQAGLRLQLIGRHPIAN